MFNLDDISAEYITEVNELCYGIFWIITETRDISDYKLLMFPIPCDIYGNHIGTPKIPLNTKTGTYNHSLLWESEIKNNSAHRPYNKKSYGYYPRGRITISNNRATIYLNPHINRPPVVNKIKLEFGLSIHNILNVRVVVDGSDHYKCFIDWDKN